MASKTEARPFLGYSDDPTAAQTSSAPSRSASPYHLDDEDLTPSRRAARGNRIARDLLIFLLASLLWLAAIFFLLPWPSTSSAVATSGQSQQSASSKPHHQLHGGGDPEVQAGSVAVDYRVHNVTSGSRWLSCGNSTAEARLAGCMYDELLNHWVPRRCASREWIDEYKDDDSWTAFADEELTQKISPEDMGSHEHYYTSIRDHVNHCAMLWRKQFWTLFEDRREFDGVIVNTYHTEHCAQFLGDLLTMNRTNPTLVRVGFSGCWVKEDSGEL